MAREAREARIEEEDKEEKEGEKAEGRIEARRSVTPMARITEEPEELARDRSVTPAVRPIIPDNLPTRVPVPAMPEHPYRNIREGNYGIQQGNLPVKPNQVTAKKPEPAYRILPAIHDPAIAAKVYTRALEAPVTISCQELLSLSPEVRSRVRDATSAKRVAKDDPIPATVSMMQDHAVTEEELSYLFPDEEIVNYDAPATQVLLADNTPILPTDAIVVEDPVDRYYRTLAPGEVPDPDKIIVAKESHALRSIVPLIDNQLKVESILDPGSQIIAMSEDVCHELSLACDPTVILTCSRPTAPSIHRSD